MTADIGISPVFTNRRFADSPKSGDVSSLATAAERARTRARITEPHGDGGGR